MDGVKVVQRDLARDAQAVREAAAAVAAQNIPRAVELARAALAGGVIHPLLLNLRSHWLAQQGRTAEALEDLRTAMAMAPNDLFVRNALGILLGKTGNWAEALTVLQETVQMAPGFAAAHFSLGWVREFTGELTEARRCFETTASLDPNFADAFAHLASLAYRRADWTGAGELAGRALAINSNNAVALTALAATALAQGELDKTEAILRRLDGRSDIPPTEASLMETTLGDLRDAQGRYREAFAAYKIRNAKKFALAAPQYDIAGATAADYVKWLADYFAAVPADWAKHSEFSPRTRAMARAITFSWLGFRVPEPHCSKTFWQAIRKSARWTNAIRSARRRVRSWWMTRAAISWRRSAQKK